LLSAPQRCYKCAGDTTVFSLAVPGGYETLNEEDGTWIADTDGPVLLIYVMAMNPELEALVRAMTQGVRVDMSYPVDDRYWMNHCAHCDAKQGDHYLGKFGGPFFPSYEDEAMARIVRKDLPVSIAVEASTAGIHILDKLIDPLG
jgi:hypothetical protein